MNRLFSLSLVTSSLLFADIDLEQLKKQMDEQQLIIQELQLKIKHLEEKKVFSHKKQDTKIPEFTSINRQQATGSFMPSFSQQAFTPDISLIVDTSYVSRDKSDAEITHLEVPGVAEGIFGSHNHGGHSESTYNANNGFNLNYAELAVSSNIDPYFRLDTIFHFSPSGVEIEEAYFTSTALDYGLRVKGGKFLSSFGYLNEHHHHIWDFNDMPLVYEAFLSSHGINEIGFQVQWVAPTSNYLMFGAEVLQGDNEAMFGNGSIGDEENPVVDGVTAPSMFVTYVKSSFDIGNTTVYGGLSYVYGDSRIDHTEDENPHAFAATSELYGIDLLVKHYFDSYSSLTWQSEVLMRDMDGRTYVLDDSASVISTLDTKKKQDGLYTQLIYGLNQSWRVGARYDSIYRNDVVIDGVNQNKEDDLYRYSAMIEYQTSEFARFRLQYNKNKSLFDEDGKRQDINTIMLQANIAIGAHGAHSF